MYIHELTDTLNIKKISSNANVMYYDISTNYPILRVTGKPIISLEIILSTCYYDWCLVNTQECMINHLYLINDPVSTTTLELGQLNFHLWLCTLSLSLTAGLAQIF